MEKMQALLGKAVICSALRQSLSNNDLLKMPVNQSRNERWQLTAGQAFAACPDVSKLAFTGQDWDSHNFLQSSEAHT